MSSAESLLVPSALLSSRWSRDNLITPEMARLYTGSVHRRIDVDTLERWLQTLNHRFGPLEVEDGSLGVLSWNIRCARRGQRSLVLLPLVIDEEGVGGRSKGAVPRRAFEHARQFTGRRLDRYLLPAADLWQLEDGAWCSRFLLPAGYFSLTFGLGSARVDLIDDAAASLVTLGQRATADVTRALLTALAYHYDPDEGSSITDVLVNDGDFIVRRSDDGTFDLRLLCARRTEGAIGTERFLLYLIQLMAYEDWSIGQELTGLPVLIGDPLLAFSSFVEGMGLRYEDLGNGRESGEERARQAIALFGQGRDGRAYSTWVDEFLCGTERAFVDDSRRPWWNLTELEQRADLARLREDREAAEQLAELARHLERAIGVGSADAADGGDKVRVNDLGRAELLGMFAAVGCEAGAAEAAMRTWFRHWPFGDARQLLQALPELGALGIPVDAFDYGLRAGEEDGSLGSLARLPKERPARLLANPEIYGGERPASNAVAALALHLPSFEGFMDDVLHDSRFGYYARRVVIGHGGHFSTHPEDLTPHYGRWVAAWAFELRRRMVEGGSFDAGAPFVVLEFGAGNGRLARDFVDAVRQRAAVDFAWREFQERVVYRIYELSESLRGKQRALLGADVEVVPGDARGASACLHRDHPNGIAGLVLSNELPDAFGVHKVILSAEGEAHAVLVLPRLASQQFEELPRALKERCQASDVLLRSLVGARPWNGAMLDHTAMREVLAYLSTLPGNDATAPLEGVWFEELLVPALAFPQLAARLRAGASEYARALAGERSGVVVYVNVHAAEFVRQVGAALSQGQVLTIDYGDTTARLVAGARIGKFPFRIYCDEGPYEPRPNHPYARPGGQDLTADVNFTDLAAAGLEAGLGVDYFGPERAIAGAELPSVLASSDQLPLAKFASSSVFKVLALGKGVTYAPVGTGLEPLALCADTLAQDAAVEARVLAIQRRLEQCCEAVLPPK